MNFFILLSFYLFFYFGRMLASLSPHLGCTLILSNSSLLMLRQFFNKYPYYVLPFLQLNLLKCAEAGRGAWISGHYGTTIITFSLSLSFRYWHSNWTYNQVIKSQSAQTIELSEYQSFPTSQKRIMPTHMFTGKHVNKITWGVK